jgi:hypothetical protein
VFAKAASARDVQKLATAIDVPSLTTMSTAVALPRILPLTQWTEDHIRAIIKATNEKDLTSAIDDFLSKNATIVVNGIQISRAEYEKQLQGEKFEETGATISFVGAVEVPADKDKPIDVSPEVPLVRESTTKLSL